MLMHTLTVYPALYWCWTGPGACNAALIPFPYQHAIISHFQLSCLDRCSLKTPVGSRKKDPNVLKKKNIGEKTVLHSMTGHICSWRPVLLSQSQLHPEKDNYQLLQQDVPLESKLCQTFLSWSTDTNCLQNSGSQRLPESEQEHSGEVPGKDQQRFSSYAEILSGCHLPQLLPSNYSSASAFPPFLGK